MSATSNTAPPVDRAVVEAFVGQAVADAAAAVSVLLTHIGDRLGLYRAMVDGDPVTAEELASRTDTNPRLVQEWLNNQTVGGYVVHDPQTDAFCLPGEHAVALAHESSPAMVQGLFDLVAAVYQSIDQEIDAFRTGTGLAWADHHPSLFTATERAFRPGYQAHLVQEWIPAAQEAAVAERVEFRLGDATSIAGRFDLIAFFDCWHDTADPLGVAEAARQALAEGGQVLLVEPLAGDHLEDNFNPLGRFGYGISTLVCTPCSISDGGPGLGAQAGEARTRETFKEAGFDTLRRAAETPLNIVYEARP